MSEQSTDATAQARLDVGDTRKPAAIKNARRVTSGDLSALAMCAHRYDPKDVRGWYTHDFDDVVRQWVCSNAESVIARLSPYCEDTRGDLPPLHPSDDLWVGDIDTGPTQTTLMTDGGLPPRPPEPSGRDWVCPGCDTAYHGKPEHVTEDPMQCFCSDECFEQFTDTDREGGDEA